MNNGGTTSCVYNENGQRVRKNTSSGWTGYFYGIDGDVQSEWNGSSWPNQYVYDGSRLLAIYTIGTTEFIRADQRGDGISDIISKCGRHSGLLYVSPESRPSRSCTSERRV